MPPNGGRLKEEKGCGVQETCRSDGSAKKFRPDEGGQRRWQAESEGGSGTRETPVARRPGGRPVPYVGAGLGIPPKRCSRHPPGSAAVGGGRAPRCGPAGGPGFECRPGSGNAARARGGRACNGGTGGLAPPPLSPGPPRNPRGSGHAAGRRGRRGRRGHAAQHAPAPFSPCRCEKAAAPGRGRSGRRAEADTAAAAARPALARHANLRIGTAGGVRLRVARRPTACMPLPALRAAGRGLPAIATATARTALKTGAPVPQAAARIGGARLRFRAEAPAAVGRRLRVGIDYRRRPVPAA